MHFLFIFLAMPVMTYVSEKLAIVFSQRFVENNDTII